MQTERRVVDLPKIVEFVEGALKKLPVKEVDVDAIPVLHDLQRNHRYCQSCDARLRHPVVAHRTVRVGR